MKRVYSHVEVILDVAAKKKLDGMFNRTSSLHETFASLNRLFFRGDYNSETHEWEYTDVKNPQIARSRLLADLRVAQKKAEDLAQAISEFREEVKNT